MYIFEIYERCPIANCGDTHTIILPGDDDLNVVNRLKEIIANDKELTYLSDTSSGLFELMDNNDFSQEFHAYNKSFDIYYSIVDKDYLVQLHEGN